MKEKVGFFMFVLLLGLWGSGAAAAPDQRYDPANDTCRKFQFEHMRAGANIFKANCLSCHHENYDNGLRPMVVLYPRAYSPGRWTRYLGDEKPQCARDGSWGGVSSDDLLKLNDYLYRGGYGTWEDYTALEFC